MITTMLVCLGFWAFGLACGLFAGWMIWSITSPAPRHRRYRHDGWPDGS